MKYNLTQNGVERDLRWSQLTASNDILHPKTREQQLMRHTHLGWLKTYPFRVMNFSKPLLLGASQKLLLPKVKTKMEEAWLTTTERNKTW